MSTIGEIADGYKSEEDDDYAPSEDEAEEELRRQRFIEQRVLQKYVGPCLIPLHRCTAYPVA